MTPVEPGSPLSDMPKLVPDREEIAQRRRAPSDEGYRPEKPAPGAPAWMQVLTGFLLIVTMILGGFAYLFKTEMDGLSDNLSLATARVEALERQLSATDESVSFNENAIEAKLSNIMSEIRKLWDVSNKRNKAWIQTAQTDIQTLQKGLSKQNSELSLVVASQTEIQTVNDSMSQKVSAIETNGQDLSKKLSEIDVELETISRSTNDKVDEVSLELRLLNDQFSGSDTVDRLTKAENLLTETGAAIESIDAYRLQTNDRLTTLQNQLRALEKSVADLSSGSTP